MQVQTMKLSDLHKTEKNIRKHSERQIKEYIRSIEMFGQTKPIVAAEDGEILVGNGLYDALTAIGRTEADVYIISGLSRAQRKKLMLADNKVYEMGFTDISALDDILLDPMKHIVKELLADGKSVQEIGKQLGMRPEEVFRLSGFTREEFLDMMTAGNTQYSKAVIYKKV